MVELSGPDGDGFVWLHAKLEDGSEESLNLGKLDEVRELFSQWLAATEERDRY